MGTLEEGLAALNKLLTIASSPQGLQLLAKIMGPVQAEVDAAVAALEDTPPPGLGGATPTEPV